MELPPCGAIPNKFQQKPLPKKIGINKFTTNSLKGNLYKTIFKSNPYRKIFQEKNLQNKYLKKSLHQNHVQRYLYQKISVKKFSDKFSHNQTWKKHIIQTKTLKRKYVPKIFEAKSLPKNLFRETCTENLRKVILLQTNFEEKFLRKKN